MVGGRCRLTCMLDEEDEMVTILLCVTEPCSLKFSVVGYFNCFHESKGCKFSLTSFVPCVCEHVGGERRRRKGKGRGREKEEGVEGSVGPPL